MNFKLYSTEDLQKLVKLEVERVVSTLYPKQKETKLLTRSEVSKLLHISTSTLDNYKRTGLIPYHKVGRRILFDLEDVKSSLILIKVSKS